MGERYWITRDGVPVDSIPQFRGSATYSWRRNISGKEYKYILFPPEAPIGSVHFPAILMVYQVELDKVRMVCRRELN